MKHFFANKSAHSVFQQFIEFSIIHLYFQEPVRIGGTSQEPLDRVEVNGVSVTTSGPSNTIMTFISSFLTFNLCDSSKQEATIETRGDAWHPPRFQ